MKCLPNRAMHAIEPSIRPPHPVRSAGGTLLLSLWICLSWLTAPALAQDRPQAWATLSNDTIPLGTSAELSVRVQSGAEVLSIPEIPPIDGLQVQYRGTANQFSSIQRNGRMTMTQERVFTYRLTPTRTGTFTLPPIEVKTADGTTKTVARDLTVTAGNGRSQQGEARISDYVQLEAQILVSRPYTYVHQEIPLLITLYWRQLDVRVSEYPSIPRENILIKNHADVNPSNPNFQGYAHDPAETITRFGQEWKRCSFRTHFYPISAGTLALEPITMNVPIRVNRSRRSSQAWDPFGDFFGSATETFTITAEPVQIEVRPIPTTDRPPEFTGAVGQFEVTHEIQPVKLMAGDPIALLIHVAGNGNYVTVQPPAFPKSDQFRVYDPTTTDVVKELPASARGTNPKPPVVGRDFEYVAVPLEAGVTEFPALNFAYFNPTTEEFATLPIGPFPIEVTPAPQGRDTAVLQSLNRPQDSPTRRDRDIVFIKTERPPNPAKALDAPLPAWAYAVHLLPGLLLCAALLAQVLLERPRRETPKSRVAKAPKVAAVALAHAERALNQGDAERFFSELHRGLQDFFAHLLDLPPAGITADNVLPKLKAIDLPDSEPDQVERLFRACDHARFGSGRLTPEEMTALLRDCRGTLARIHKYTAGRRTR